MRKRKKIKDLVFPFLISFLIFILTSCLDRQRRAASLSGNPLFDVEEVTPSRLIPIDVRHKEGFFIVNLKTCITDSFNRDVPLQGVLFTIEYETNFYDSKGSASNRMKIETARSDSKGCIRWHEIYKFRFIKNPVWIGLNRTIKTEANVYSGVPVSVTIAVNPWLLESDKGQPPILDMKYYRDHRMLKNRYKENGLAFLSEKSEDEYPQLWVSRLSFQLKINPQRAFQNVQKVKNDSDKVNLCDKEKDEEERGKCREDQRIRQLLLPYQTPCTEENEEACYKRYLKLTLLIPLELRRYNTDGEIDEEEVNSGTYDVNYQIVFIPYQEETPYRLHDKVCEGSDMGLDRGQLQQMKFLNLSCDIKFSFFNKNGTYKVYVEIKPHDRSVLPFKTFQGTYTLEQEDFDFSGSLRERRIDLKVDNYYKEILSTREEVDLIPEVESIVKFKNRPGNRNLILNESFYPPTLDEENIFKFVRVKNTAECSENENVVRRTVIFSGKICLTDTMSDKDYPQTPFHVFLEKPKIDEKGRFIEEVFASKQGQLYTTDQEGCIWMPITLEHNFYNRQKYFPVDIYFLSEGLNLYGHVKARLSPWQTGFQAHQDATKISEGIFGTNAARPRLIINQFKSVNLFPSYGLDKFLNIHTYHRVYVLFQPFIERHDNLALGLSHRARELLRDGYYMVRLLLLRNPQEREDMNRMSKSEESNKMRGILLNEQLHSKMFDMEDPEYITHTDLVAKAEANFLNVYMPLYITTQQLYYMASRNLVSIEVVPVDPSGFVFKKVTGDEPCELDLQKTKWKPFPDIKHELTNHPYVGAFNMKDWTNWNPLKRSYLNSDEIIEKSEIGKKYKLFDLTNPEKESAKNISFVCTNGLRENLYRYPSEKEINECVREDYLESSFDKKIVEGQIRKKTEEALVQQDILKEFAEQNALKFFDLSPREGDDFIGDIKKAQSKIRLKREYYFKLLQFLSLIPDEDKRHLEKQISSQCFSWWSKLLERITPSSWFNHSSCYNEIIKTYLVQVQNRFNELKSRQIENESDETDQFLEMMGLFDTLEQIKEKDFYSLLANERVSLDKETVQNIIDKRVNNQNADDLDVLSFARSLCYFWFDSYLRKYLEKEQMISAYTDYIRQFDYYKILEAEGPYPDAESVFKDFIEIAGMKSNKGFENCHLKYVKCIFSDHCHLRSINTVKNKYCHIMQKGEGSCKKILNEECDKDPFFSLCNQESTNCNDSLNDFCRSNGDHPICYKFSNRCLVNYRSCVQKELFDPELIVNFESMRTEDPLDMVYPFMVGGRDTFFSNPLSVCLENPYHFFKFENKVVVYDFSNPVYKGGYMKNFTTAVNFSIGTSMSWSAQRSHTVSAGADANVSFGEGFGAGLNLGVNQSMSSNESNSRRRASDARAGEAKFLTVGNIKVKMNVTKFRKCLVVKPRPHAFFGRMTNRSNEEQGLYKRFQQSIWKEETLDKEFKKIFVSRPGLILCNPYKEQEEGLEITEEYYYISQSYEGTQQGLQFLNLQDLKNRPFVIVLRGRREFVKFYRMVVGVIEGDNGDIDQNTGVHSIPGNMFINYPFPIEETIGLSLAIREFDETGFYPGIYDYAEDSDRELDRIEKEGKNFSSSFFEWFRNTVNLFDIPAPSNREIPVQ